MRGYAAAFAASLAMTAGFPISTAHAAPTNFSIRPVAPVSSGSCVIKKTEYAAANSFDDTTSGNWVNLGDAGSITFTQGRAGCVSGSFSASAGNLGNGDSVRLQVLLDGNTCDPLTGNYSFANYGTDFSSHSVAYFCGASIGAGTHTIQVQYHSGSGGDAQIYQRTLQVAHR